MLRIPRLLRHALSLAALSIFAWLVAVPCADAAYMIPGQPLRPKDFTLVKKDGYLPSGGLRALGSSTETHA